MSNEEIESKYQDLLNGFHITRARVRYFEAKYQMPTREFLDRFREGELLHSFDFDDWIGESRMLATIEKKLARLSDIQIVP